MADISVERKQGSGGGGNAMTIVWAIVAIASVVGLMAWLLSTQGTTTQVVTEGETGDTLAAESGGATETAGEAADLPSIGAAPDSYVGRNLQVSGVEVAAVLGNRGFWADVPGTNPFLVILEPDVTDTAWLESGATVTVEGTVEPVTDATLDQWVQAEAIRPAARDEASFATHYLRATGVQQ